MLKLGEIKRVNGIWLKCVSNNARSTCQACYFDKSDQYGCLKYQHELGDCSGLERRNGISVIFVEIDISKEIEKIENVLVKKINELNEIFEKHIQGKKEVEVMLKKFNEFEKYVNLTQEIASKELALSELKKCS